MRRIFASAAETLVARNSTKEVQIFTDTVVKWQRETFMNVLVQTVIMTGEPKRTGQQWPWARKSPTVHVFPPLQVRVPAQEIDFLQLLGLSRRHEEPILSLQYGQARRSAP